jgi:hypothetical protein
MASIVDSDIYLHLSSVDVSKTLIPDNISSHFTIELPSTLILQGTWEMAIVEFTCVFTTGIKYGDFIQIYCDVIEVSPVKEKWLPLLRHMTFAGPTKRPDILLDYRYTKIIPGTIKRIGIQLKLTSIKALIDERVPTFIVLHLRKSG